MGRPKLCNPCCAGSAGSSIATCIHEGTCGCNTANQYRVTVSGLTGSYSGASCTVLNGTHTVSYTGVTGQWFYGVFNYQVRLSTVCSTNSTSLSFWVGTPLTLMAANYRTTCFKCDTGGLFTLDSISGCSGWPATLNVTKV